MKKFNPNKELNKKERKYTKKHLLFSLLGLIGLTILGISFAYFQVNDNSVVINSVVDAPIELLVYVDGEEVSGFPAKEAGYVYDSITCKNNSTGTWDETTWSLNINFKSNDACIVYFEVAPPYTDSTLAGSDPVLDSKMVPVNIADTGVVTVADIYEDAWYNYAESKWANAVIVDPTFTTLDPGTTIPMESIEQMYVWIPRYEYKKSSIVSAQESIEINFVPVTKTSTTEQVNNDDVIVHPAFCWGDYCQTNRSHVDNVELSGIWVGKFEMGFNEGETETTANVEYIIKPNVNSVHNTSISTMFDKINNVMGIYSLDSTTDVHMMKNTEWGAVAYLSQSQYGICEDDVTCSVKVENNNYYNSTSQDIVTGCGGTSVAQNVSSLGINICPASNRWETLSGIKASTTHNITGIYDMAGGRIEEVMGNMQNSSGNFNSNSAWFTSTPEQKYYDSYAYSSKEMDYTKGLIGDGMLELNPAGDSSPGDYIMENWNGDGASIDNSTLSWFRRGGHSMYGDIAGIWTFEIGNGDANEYYTTRATACITK